jgi:hypothetical protein
LVVQNLYKIDFISAHKFIYEDLVKYADCNHKWDVELGETLTCKMSKKYLYIVPQNLTKGIAFNF